MSRPEYAIRDGVDQLRVTQQYRDRPRDGLVLRVEQRTTRSGRSLLLSPEQVAGLRDWLSDWLGSTDAYRAEDRLAAVRRLLADDVMHPPNPGGTHSDDCHTRHPRCLVQRLRRAVDGGPDGE